MFDDIYTYIEQNFNIKITDYQFKRDYIKNPLYIAKNGIGSERPYKEDLEYLYIKLNITRINLSILFNISPTSFSRWIKYYNLIKPLNKILLNSKNTKIKKYNNPYYFDKEKLKETNLKKYGCECSLQNKNIKEKSFQTKLKKYGNIHFNNSLKTKQTKLKKYNDPYYFDKEKLKETNLKKYGCEYYTQSQEYKNYWKNDEFIKNTLEKQYITKKKNNSFSISTDENKILKLLKLKFNNIETEFKNTHYPFKCDFYIPAIDTYIEYQGHWTHGKEPYIGNDKQKEKLKLWESKNTKYYKKAIKTWTERDPLKRQTAKDNNLNWVEFFNMNQFMDWYNNIS